MSRPTPIRPQPGQESVWDYPRPPRVELSQKKIEIIFNSEVIAVTERSQRVLETSHPPVYYLPPEDVQTQYLEPSEQGSYCEWKGRGIYYNLVVGDRRVLQAVWSYPHPSPNFQAIQNYLAFYPGLMDACYVNGEQVKPQPGGFYGGWITADVVGPFKGIPGSWGW